MVSFCDYNSIISQTLNFNCLETVRASAGRQRQKDSESTVFASHHLLGAKVQNIQTTELQIESKVNKQVPAGSMEQLNVRVRH